MSDKPTTTHGGKPVSRAKTKDQILVANLEFKTSIVERIKAVEKQRDELQDLMARTSAKLHVLEEIFDDLDNIES